MNDNLGFLADTWRFSIHGFVANRISKFLLTSDKGARFHTNKTTFYQNNKDRYSNLLGESNFLFEIAFLQALEHPYTWFYNNINPTVYKFDWIND